MHAPPNRQLNHTLEDAVAARNFAQSSSKPQGKSITRFEGGGLVVARHDLHS